MAFLIHIASSLFGLITALVILASPRLGRRSYWLVPHLLLAGFGTGIVAYLDLNPDSEGHLALSLALTAVLISFPGAVLFATSLSGDRGRLTPLPLLAAGAAFALGIGWFVGSGGEFELSIGLLRLELWGHVLGGALLVCTIFILVALEQVLRGTRDPYRWAIKFPVLGLGLSALAGIFLATELLLYQSVSIKELSLFSTAFLISAPLILIGWRRISTERKIRLSHAAVYGGMTLVAVGIYLILASLFVYWVGSLESTGAEAGAFAFLLAIAFLATALLSTQVRHQLRGWVRRNFFRGRYDYRAFWLEAEERIRHNAPPTETARALADLVHRAVGSIEITIWLRTASTGRFRVEVIEGETEIARGEESEGLLDILERGAGPADVLPVADESSPTLRELCERARAEVLIPLRSEERTLGFATIGSNRTGRPFETETYEFLRVLGRHAARELHKRDLMAAQLAAREAHAFQSFATFVLHDLKNFASTLSLVARNATRHSENPEFLRDAFESVLDTAEKMKRLCNSLRTFSQPTRPDPSPRDLNRIVREVAVELETTLEGRLDLQLGELPPLTLDEEAIGSLVRNLLMNAVEAIAPDGRIGVTTRPRDGLVELEVRDDGVGIPGDFLADSLFQPFRTTKSTGLGIGLFQCKRVAEAHGGTVEVTSRDGEGTTVRVLLPMPTAPTPAPTGQRPK